jgi:hypothetical protein
VVVSVVSYSAKADVEGGKRPLELFQQLPKSRDFCPFFLSVWFFSLYFSSLTLLPCPSFLLP